MINLLQQLAEQIDFLCFLEITKSTPITRLSNMTFKFSRNDTFSHHKNIKAFVLTETATLHAWLAAARATTAATNHLAATWLWAGSAADTTLWSTGTGNTWATAPSDAFSDTTWSWTTLTTDDFARWWAR